MNKQTWKAVFFDLDDTLYSRAVPFAEACEDFFGGDKELPFDPVCAHERFRKRGDEVFLPSRRGEITMEEMYIYRFQKAMEDLGVKVSDADALRFQTLYQSRQNRIHLEEQVCRILTLVREKQRMMGVITNGPADHQRDKFLTLGLDAFMDPAQLYVSGAYGSNKPETRMFEAAEEKTGLSAADFLYIGDSFESDVCGAAAAGWDVLWLDPAGKGSTDAESAAALKEIRSPGRKARVYTAANLQEVYGFLEKTLQ